MIYLLSVDLSQKDTQLLSRMAQSIGFEEFKIVDIKVSVPLIQWEQDPLLVFGNKAKVLLQPYIANQIVSENQVCELPHIRDLYPPEQGGDPTKRQETHHTLVRIHNSLIQATKEEEQDSIFVTLDGKSLAVTSDPENLSNKRPFDFSVSPSTLQKLRNALEVFQVSSVELVKHSSGKDD